MGVLSAKNWLRDLTRKDVEKLAVNLVGGVLRGSEVDQLPVKGKPPKLPAGEKPFVHPFYWTAFVLIGEPE